MKKLVREEYEEARHEAIELAKEIQDMIRITGIIVRPTQKDVVFVRKLALGLRRVISLVGPEHPVPITGESLD